MKQEDYKVIATCDSKETTLFSTEMQVYYNGLNNIICGVPIDDQTENGHCDSPDTWTQRDDLNWVLKIKEEVEEFIEESDGIVNVVEEFEAYAYPNLYINNTKTEIVIQWVLGLPLSMVAQSNEEIGKKMQKYGYTKEDAVDRYYEVFSVFLAHNIYYSTNRHYKFSWAEIIGD